FRHHRRAGDLPGGRGRERDLPVRWSAHARRTVGRVQDRNRGGEAMTRLCVTLAAFWLAIVPALAQEAQLANPQLEQRARDLSREIRCVVCQSQSVADSDADIARELRVLIREQIAAGKSDQEIRDYLVARYGDF